MRKNAASGPARLHLARLVARDRSAEAAALWKEAARRMPRGARRCLDLARVAASDGEATRWLEAALERDEKLAGARYRLSRLYQKSGQQELSERHLARFGS